ncbi:MAG: GNAT family N-acetyltransferase [Deltaproteobacteria bacterium]|nr:GNAT family N-acetyltransferase [Deltaproteobacteria bacterium]
MNTITTDRLTLRSFSIDDIKSLVDIADDRRIADGMISIPHPYTIQYAEQWIKMAEKNMKADISYYFAITLNEDNRLISSIELRAIEMEHLHAETSFWIGSDWQGNGYATEAANAMIKFGFITLGLNRIYAHHMLRNRSSENVLKKIGMTCEGTMRQRVIKWGIFEDVGFYAIIKQDLQSA